MAVVAGEGAVLVALKYLYPALVFLYYLASSVLASCTLQALKKTEDAQPERPSRRAVIYILGFFLSTYGAQLITLGTQSVITRSAPLEHQVINYLSCILVFGILCIQLIESDTVVWFPFRGSWFIALLFELAIAILTAVNSRQANLNPYDILHIAFLCLRLASLVILVAWTCLALWTNSNPSLFDEETQPLLPPDGEQPDAQAATGEPANSSSYGSTTQSDSDETFWERREREGRAEVEKRLQEGGNWVEYVKGFKILLPYVWPLGNRSLQLRAVAVLLCMLASNAINVLIPRQTAIIMDTLNGKPGNPWTAVINFALLRLLASASGVDLIRQWLWLPVKHFSRESLSRASFSHVMKLSADFHDSKNSSDMIMAMNGGYSITNAIENLLFQTVPMLIDMCIAIAYLSVKFGPYEGLITVATGIVFITLAARLVANTKNSTRKRIKALTKENTIRYGGLTSWRTVNMFNQIVYEDNRHADAVTARWLSETQFQIAWLLSTSLQTIVLTAGLMASAFLAVFRIRSGQASPGQFAMLLMYWTQLTAPLQFFASLSKGMSDDFISAERLLAIMKAKPSVTNKQGARPLKFQRGDVHLDQVCFGYDKRKRIVNGISLDVPAGTTVAFVGSTGAGKSTLLRLLQRDYDVTSGSIRIDGQDLRDVDISSLRERIGYVPQSPLVFNDTIMNNVRYSRITATDEEVFAACRAARIHDKILGFADGYESEVGEHGVKLSGGELQRLAIARALLKNPEIVLLDEATAAVDNVTEKHIQKSINALCKGRTTFVVAHRLSTIKGAGVIAVVEHGQIIEKGTHDELIALRGRYFELASDNFQEREDSDDQAKVLDDANTLANDSCSERTTTETCKTHGEDGQAKVPPESDGKSATGKRCQKEGSRLNPVAPEFTPRSMAATAANSGPKTASESKSTTPSAIGKTRTWAVTGHPSKLRWSDEVSIMDERGTSSTPKSLSTESSRRLGAKDSSESSFTASELRASETMPAVIGIQNPGIKPLPMGGKAKPNSIEASGRTALPSLARRSPESIAETAAVPSNIGNVVFMRPRYSRRIQSKSEPVHKSPKPESAKCSEPSAKSTDTNTEQCRVSAQTAQSSSPAAPSMIPRPGNRASPTVRQLPIPPRHSSDGKCGTYPTPAPKDNSGRASEGILSVTKDKETTSVVAASTAKNENHPLPKMGENQSIMMTSSRGGRAIRRPRAGSLRGRRGRISRGPVGPGSQE
ncbi:uncharacterized protein Triagg1_7915 [Trichoderma aggressivum f. europaeum]|uniref:Heavy metal tolerance protein n=1 Tax=Trichoderma aggressivum f. europaeum TaxID=173218 RepID=A0AAE1I972_9HYPO|nr:hypothetical protein Triagg1_7915 [Trichoderma aggressivum f. europaeum]